MDESEHLLPGFCRQRRAPQALDGLAVHADGTNAERSGKLAGQVFRLVPRGRLERVAGTARATSRLGEAPPR